MAQQFTGPSARNSSLNSKCIRSSPDQMAGLRTSNDEDRAVFPSRSAARTRTDTLSRRLELRIQHQHCTVLTRWTEAR